MRDLARRAQLVVKLRERGPFGRDAFRQKFQGDRLIERQIFGAVHLAHAALAEHCDQSIAAGDDGAGSETTG